MRLRLPSAARALYTAAGRLVKVLDTRHPDLCPNDDGELPPLWVSCGEPWIDATKESQIKAKKHEYHQLKKQLRTLCDKLRVSVAGQIEAPVSEEERTLYDQLQQGRRHLAEMQKTIDKLSGRATLDEGSRLVQAPRAVRLRVRRNGTWTGPWKLCWGSSLQELLTSCSKHFGFAVRKLYTSSGMPVVDMAELRVDQRVYVSSGEPFVDSKALKEQIKARAEFAQALRLQHKSDCMASEADNGKCECEASVRQEDHVRARQGKSKD